MTQPNTIGIVAGSGDLPLLLVEAALQINQPVFVLWLGNEQDIPFLFKQVPHASVNIAAVGKAIKILRQANVLDIIFAGKVSRPAWSELRPDATGLKLMGRIANLSKKGDDGLLSAIIQFFEENQFRVVGVEQIVQTLLAPAGCLTRTEPNSDAHKDITLGQRILHDMGHLDVGQSIVVQQGIVLGIEAIEGTDCLIERTAPLAHKGSAPVLVKRKKRTQDHRIDLPVIGLGTVEKAHLAGLQGIAIEANTTLILRQEEVIKKLDQYGMFLIGFETAEIQACYT